jgi:SAM-dependent methyltransferase
VTLGQLPKSLSRADWSRMLIDTADPKKADPRLPGLPPEEVQKLTNNMAGKATMKAAAGIFANFSTLVSRHLDQTDAIRILDFGCGWGRIARFLPHLTETENIYGVDVDERLIQACRDHLTPMHFEVITSGQPLPFGAEAFDVVISNSVFSHFSEASHRFHVDEIARVLRPGGLFLGTTLSTRSIASMYDKSADWITGITGPRKTFEAQLAAGAFVYASTGRWTDYGIAFLPDGWTRNNWAPAFDVIDMLDGAQVINVGRRYKASAGPAASGNGVKWR